MILKEILGSKSLHTFMITDVSQLPTELAEIQALITLGAGRTHRLPGTL